MTTIEGNILDINTPAVIVQQVNCRGKMGKGLALQIADEWPQVKRDYLDCCFGRDPHQLLGRVCFTFMEPHTHVACAFGQLNYGKDGARYTDYHFWPSMLEEIHKYSRQVFTPVYIPHGIGCGWAGGEWRVMEPIIEKYCPSAIIVKFSP
jgi:O-acetyl-ADP-ribose deacetylase (regulator of RNase III)